MGVYIQLIYIYICTHICMKTQEICGHIWDHVWDIEIRGGDIGDIQGHVAGFWGNIGGHGWYVGAYIGV